MPLSIDKDIVQDVTQTAELLERFTDDEQSFRLLVQSFRAQDYEGYRDLLNRLKLLDRCRLVCEWLAAKHCTLLCFELCGPPPKEPPQLELVEFGKIISEITAKPEMLERLAGAVIEQDERAFQAIVEKLGLARYCHYICQWICSIYYRMICRNLCSAAKPIYNISCVHLVPELMQAGSAVSRLLGNEIALAGVQKAVAADDADALRAVLDRGGFQGVCRWICFWICGWRCVHRCITLCRPFPAAPVDEVLPEIWEFSQVVAKLTGHPRLTAQLVKAVSEGDQKTYAKLVEQLGFARFCHQLCFWICRLYCHHHCIIVCPQVKPRPWFTHVGHFHIYGDIDNTSGLTNKLVMTHGGPGYGFHKCMELRGFCPATSPDAPGAAMQYRFLYEHNGSRVPLIGSQLCEVNVGSRTIYWDVDGTGLVETFQTVRVAGSGATTDPTPTPPVPAGTAWGPPPTHVVVPDSDGWIAVDPNALGAGFNGALVGFNSLTSFPGGSSSPGVAAGTQVPSGNLKNGDDIAIIFEATRVGGPTSPPDYSNTLSRIHINNWREVNLLDLLQFHSGGGTPCSPLAGDLDIEYTIDHELLAKWTISIATAAPVATPSWTGTTTRNAAGANTVFGTPPCGHFHLADLFLCGANDNKTGPDQRDHR